MIGRVEDLLPTVRPSIIRFLKVQDLGGQIKRIGGKALTSSQVLIGEFEGPALLISTAPQRDSSGIENIEF